MTKENSLDNSVLSIGAAGVGAAAAELAEPSASSRLIAFNILRRHPPCLRDDVPMNDLIDDIATAIDRAAS